MTDTFSVAMCTYNGSRYLGAQLESIATQTRLPDELVICDDHSVDDTVSVIEKFAACAPFPVRLEVNTLNVGSTRNFELAINRCQGKLIALADQDDVWSPSKLEIIEAEFLRRPGVGLVFSDAELVDCDLRSLGERLWTSIGFDEKLRRKMKTEGGALQVLLPGWTVTGATMAFRAQFRTLALPIPDDLPMIHDGWIALMIAAVADVSFIEQPLIKYRQHEQQQIGAPESKVEEGPKGIENFKQAVTRTNTYTELISISERVRFRLIEHCEMFDCNPALRVLDAGIKHFRLRQTLPDSKFRRVPGVFGELFRVRYHRYSRGLRSALKDLLTSNDS